MDNALPHVLSDADLTEAARQMRAKLRPGGTLLASIRDYDQLVRDRPTVQGPAFYSDSGHRRIVFQVWDWADDRLYTRFISTSPAKRLPGATTSAHPCIARSTRKITEILASSGFANIRWLFPNESGFYQPVVIATAIG
jgi:hypothetical protein